MNDCPKPVKFYIGRTLFTAPNWQAQNEILRRSKEQEKTRRHASFAPMYQADYALRDKASLLGPAEPTPQELAEREETDFILKQRERASTRALYGNLRHLRGQRLAQELPLGILPIQALAEILVVYRYDYSLSLTDEQKAVAEQYLADNPSERVGLETLYDVD